LSGFDVSKNIILSLTFTCLYLPKLTRPATILFFYLYHFMNGYSGVFKRGNLRTLVKLRHLESHNTKTSSFLQSEHPVIIG
jgi:hypothetical protein